MNHLIGNEPGFFSDIATIHENIYNYYKQNVEDQLYVLDIFARIDALIPEEVLGDIISNFDRLAYEASKAKRIRSKAYTYFEKSLNKALIHYVKYILIYLRRNILILNRLGLLDPEFGEILNQYEELYPYPQGIVGAVLNGLNPTDKDMIIYTNYILKFYP